MKRSLCILLALLMSACKPDVDEIAPLCAKRMQLYATKGARDAADDAAAAAAIATGIAAGAASAAAVRR